METLRIKEIEEVIVDTEESISMDDMNTADKVALMGLYVMTAGAIIGFFAGMIYLVEVVK